MHRLLAHVIIGTQRQRAGFALALERARTGWVARELGRCYLKWQRCIELACEGLVVLTCSLARPHAPTRGVIVACGASLSLARSSPCTRLGCVAESVVEVLEILVEVNAAASMVLLVARRATEHCGPQPVRHEG